MDRETKNEEFGGLLRRECETMGRKLDEMRSRYKKKSKESMFKAFAKKLHFCCHQQLGQDWQSLVSRLLASGWCTKIYLLEKKYGFGDIGLVKLSIEEQMQVWWSLFGSLWKDNGAENLRIESREIITLCVSLLGFKLVALGRLIALLVAHCVTTADSTHIDDFTKFYCCYALALLLCARICNCWNFLSSSFVLPVPCNWWTKYQLHKISIWQTKPSMDNVYPP